MSGKCEKCGEHCLECRCNEPKQESLVKRMEKIEEILNICLYVLAEISIRGEDVIMISKAQKLLGKKKKRKFYIRGVTPLTKGRKRPGEL
jgi:hypothetical protein